MSNRTTTSGRPLRAAVVAACGAVALVAPDADAHGVLDVVATIGPTVTVDAASGWTFAGLSLSGGLGGDMHLTALFFRVDLQIPILGVHDPAFSAAMMWRWDIGATSHRLGIAAGLSGGIPFAGARVELLAQLTEGVAFVASVSPGVRVDGEDGHFAVPITVGIDVGNF